MTVRIIKDHETQNQFEDRVVLVDMGEPGLYAVAHDPSFLLAQVRHEYVCFNARYGEVVRLDESAIETLNGLGQ